MNPPRTSNHPRRWLPAAMAAIAAACLGSANAATEYLNETLRDGNLPAGWAAFDVAFPTGAGGYANISGTTGALISKSFNAAAESRLTLSYSVAKFGSGGDGPLTIEYSLDGSDSESWFSLGETSIPTSSTYIDEQIEIPATSANMAVRFLANNSPSAKRLRDVTITEFVVTPLAITSLSPASGATGVPVFPEFVVTFNQPVQAGTGNLTVHVAGTGTVVQTAAITAGMITDNTLTVLSVDSLLQNTEYYVLIEPTTVTGLEGQAFSGITSPTDWTFTTVAPDTTGPVPVAFDPSSGSINFTTTPEDLFITFDEPITLVGTQPIELRLASDNSLIESIPTNDFFSVFVDGENLDALGMFVFSSLDFATEYYVSFPAGTVQDQLGNPNLAFGSPSSDIPWTFTTFGEPQPPVVVVNKYANVGSGSVDLFELLVIGDEAVGSTLDMRGMIVKDFSSSMANDGGGKYEFNNLPLWENVPVGTLIVLSGGNSSPDIDPADFKLNVGLADTALFTKLGTGTFDIAATEMIMIKAAGSGEAGVAGGIHALAAGTPGAQFDAFPGPKLIASGTTSTGNAVIANTTTGTLDDYNGEDATGSVAIAEVTFGGPNNPANAIYITQLRGTMLGEGDGVVSLVNATPASPFAGSPVFGRGLAGQVAELTLNSSLPSVTLTDITIEVPVDFGTPGGVALSGPGGAAANSSIAGQTVTITGAGATIDEALIVTISGLTAPVPTLGTDYGSRAFSVSTAPSGGNLTTIASNPGALVTIPIATLRETTPNGVAVALGQRVAIEGVATVESFQVTRTEAGLQDATAGIALFSPSAPSPFTRGNRYVVYGAVTQFRGLTQVTYAGAIDLGADTEPTPLVLTIPQLLANPEAYEGSLVTVQNLSYVSGNWQAASNVILQDAASNTLLIRIQPGSTATSEPVFPVNITGFFSQFDSSNPFTSGYQLQPRDASDLAPGTVPTNTFASWIAKFPGVGTETGFFDDPDKDGIPNLLEHVLGLAPDVPNGAAMTVSDGGDGTITLTHTRIKPEQLDPGVTPVYQWSAGLDTWATSGAQVAGVTVEFGQVVILDDSHPDYDVVQVTATVTGGSAAQLFVRLLAVPPA